MKPVKISVGFPWLLYWPISAKILLQGCSLVTRENQRHKRPAQQKRYTSSADSISIFPSMGSVCPFAATKDISRGVTTIGWLIFFNLWKCIPVDNAAQFAIINEKMIAYFICVSDGVWNEKMLVEHSSTGSVRKNVCFLTLLVGRLD